MRGEVELSPRVVSPPHSTVIKRLVRKCGEVNGSAIKQLSGNCIPLKFSFELHFASILRPLNCVLPSVTNLLI